MMRGSDTWELHESTWALSWNECWEEVQEWNRLGGLWTRSQVRIEEYELDGEYEVDDNNGRYIPVSRT